MNTIIKKLLLCFIVLAFAACDENKMFEEELYKKVICIVSDDDQVFAIEHDLNLEESTGHISINCGGTNRIDQDVTVDIEANEELLAEYNRLQYDTATMKFARQLSDSRYRIPVMSTTLKAGGKDTYSLIEINVKPDGLSPDSLYMIPLRISHVSAYETNPDKEDVLYRVLIKNDYARQKENTYYRMKGTRLEEENIGDSQTGTGTPTGADKIFVPISKNKVRMLAGTVAYKGKSPTLEEIDESGIIVEINEDNTLKLIPAGSVQMEMLGEPNDNRYEEVNGTQIFYFSYRYYGYSTSRQKNMWITMTERCTRKDKDIE